MIDLYGGSVEIFFQGKDGKPRNVANLALNVTTGGQKVYPNFVESIRIKNNILSFTEMEVTFTPPYEQAINLINSGVIGMGFQGPAKGAKSSESPDSAGSSLSSFNFNTVSIRLHYGGKKSPWYKGILTAPDISIDAEDISIKIKAVGMLFESTKVSNKEVFESSSRKQILEKVSKDISERASIVINPKDGVAKKALSKLEDYNHTDSNWRVFKEMLTKANCVIIDKGASGPSGKPVYEIVSKDFLRRQQKGIPTFVIRRQIDPNKNIFPILALETSINNVLFGQTIGIQSTVFDKENNEEESKEDSGIGSETAKDFSGKRPLGDGSQGGGGSEEQKKNRANIHVPTGQIKDSLKGLIQEFTDAPLQYTIRTVGIVDLIPGTPAKISVPGAKFLSNTYDLYEVEHNFTRGGVETTCTLARTLGFASAAADGVEAVKAAVTNSSQGNSKSSSETGLIK